MRRWVIPVGVPHRRYPPPEEERMPTGPGKYRVTTTKSGEKVRLHFTPSGTVNEAKNLKTGATHTPAEFKADRKKGKK